MGKRYGGYLRLHGLLWFEVVQDLGPSTVSPRAASQQCAGRWGCTVKVGIREELGHKLIRCPERVVRPEARETKNEEPYYLGKIRIVTNIFQMG